MLAPSTEAAHTVRDNFFVLTGASGAGKSSIIAALERQGFRCVNEMGRQVVRDELRAGSNGTPWQDSDRFMALVFARYVEAFVTMPERRAPVFFDRGIPESIGSALAAGLAPDPGRLHAATHLRYNRTVFVTPPWPEIYVTDAERRHTFEEGVAHHRAELAAYIACGYAPLEVPRAPIEDRVAFILQNVSRLSRESAGPDAAAPRGGAMHHVGIETDDLDGSTARIDMNRTGPGLVVLYRWRLHAGQEASFTDAWSRITAHLRNEGGSLGSRLHRGNDGLWYGYAQWPSEAARQLAFAQAFDPAASAQMRSAIAESLPEVLLDPVADYLALPPT